MLKEDSSLRTKIKIAVAVLAIAGIATFILINMEVIEINLLVARIEVRRSIMILGVFAVGFIFGWVVKSLSAAARKKEPGD